MRLVILTIFASCILAGCKSQKHVVENRSVDTDSLAHSEHHRTILRIDSAIHSVDFAFDTLAISVQRQVADTIEIVRLKAVKGQVLSHRKQNQYAADHEERLDTLAYKLASSEATAEHTATTRAYDPPNTTAIILCVLLLGGIMAYLYFRRKL